MAVFELVASKDERPSEASVERIQKLNDALDAAAEGGATLDMAQEEFWDFIVRSSVEEARKVLFQEPRTEEERRRAGAAFLSATTELYRRAGRTSSRSELFSRK